VAKGFVNSSERIEIGRIMSITIHPPLETELRAKAEAEGISVDAYLERLLRNRRGDRG
jgi:hypothetical protein